MDALSKVGIGQDAHPTPAGGQILPTSPDSEVLKKKQKSNIACVFWKAFKKGKKCLQQHHNKKKARRAEVSPIESWLPRLQAPQPLVMVRDTSSNGQKAKHEGLEATSERPAALTAAAGGAALAASTDTEESDYREPIESTTPLAASHQPAAQLRQASTYSQHPDFYDSIHKIPEPRAPSAVQEANQEPNAPLASPTSPDAAFETPVLQPLLASQIRTRIQNPFLSDPITTADEPAVPMFRTSSHNQIPDHHNSIVEKTGPEAPPGLGEPQEEPKTPPPSPIALRAEIEELAAEEPVTLSHLSMTREDAPDHYDSSKTPLASPTTPWTESEALAALTLAEEADLSPATETAWADASPATEVLWAEASPATDIALAEALPALEFFPWAEASPAAEIAEGPAKDSEVSPEKQVVEESAKDPDDNTGIMFPLLFRD